MTVAIHQPNYLPWIGYFLKIYLSDKFIFLDDVQFARDGFTKRTCIRKNLYSSERKYLTVPVKKSSLRTLVKDIKIDGHSVWVENHLNSILESYRKSKYFQDYMTFFADILPEAYSRHKDLASFNVYLIERVCRLLEIELHFQRSSSFSFRKPQKFDRIKNVLENCGAHLYISGVGALAYNEEEYFREQGIVCKYMNILDFLREKDMDMGFDPTMSIIDALMNTGVEAIRELFGSYRRTLGE